jgi:hypothetical protein
LSILAPASFFSGAFFHCCPLLFTRSSGESWSLSATQGWFAEDVGFRWRSVASSSPQDCSTAPTEGIRGTKDSIELPQELLRAIAFPTHAKVEDHRAAGGAILPQLGLMILAALVVHLDANRRLIGLDVAALKQIAMPLTQRAEAFV